MLRAMRLVSGREIALMQSMLLTSLLNLPSVESKFKFPSGLYSELRRTFSYLTLCFPCRDFARAYHCPAGSRMNPEDKCSLW